MLGLHLAIVKLAANGYNVSVASSTLEKGTILSDRYFKPPHGGNGGEKVKNDGEGEGERERGGSSMSLYTKVQL